MEEEDDGTHIDTVSHRRNTDLHLPIQSAGSSQSWVNVISFAGGRNHKHPVTASNLVTTGRLKVTLKDSLACTMMLPNQSLQSKLKLIPGSRNKGNYPD